MPPLTFIDTSSTDVFESISIFNLLSKYHKAPIIAIFLSSLTRFGFKVEEVNHSISDELVKKYRLTKGEILPVCFKGIV